MADELLIKVKQMWPTEDRGTDLGVKQDYIVPVEDLDDPEILDFRNENAVLTPGWINAHSHLELTHCPNITYEGDFVDWIYNVLEFKLAQEKEDIRDAYREGCRKLLSSGVCRVFDHCDKTEWILDIAKDVQIDARPLKELIAFVPEQIEDVLTEAENFLNSLPDQDLSGGLAPHAPYSAHPEVYEKSAELVREHGAILSTHINETEEELKFTRDSSGRFQDLLEDRTGTRRESPYEDGTVGNLIERGVFNNPGLGIHMNYLDEAELRWMEGQELYPVFCPRSYSYFGHDTKPLLQWRQHNISFCLGTDSMASNNKLNMISELRKLHELMPGLNPSEVLKSLTTHPSRVMKEPERGELTYGTPADLSVFETPSGQLEELTSGDADPLAVVSDGQVVWSAE